MPEDYIKILSTPVTFKRTVVGLPLTREQRSNCIILDPFTEIFFLFDKNVEEKIKFCLDANRAHNKDCKILAISLAKLFFMV
uniref:Uncharacterized protein n=1 Tax=Strongyloides venezuelensis TaxID=75913 RepID=A0A0K0FSV6_STRVS